MPINMISSINGVPFDSVEILRTTFVLRTIRMCSWAKCTVLVIQHHCEQTFGTW